MPRPPRAAAALSLICPAQTPSRVWHPSCRQPYWPDLIGCRCPAHFQAAAVLRQQSVADVKVHRIVITDCSCMFQCDHFACVCVFKKLFVYRPRLLMSSTIIVKHKICLSPEMCERLQDVLCNAIRSISASALSIVVPTLLQS